MSPCIKFDVLSKRENSKLLLEFLLKRKSGNPKWFLTVQRRYGQEHRRGLNKGQA